MERGKNEHRIGARQLVARGAFLAGMLALGLGVGAIQGARAHDNRNDLQGVWDTRVTFIDCETGDPLQEFPAQSLNTFNADGTALVSDNTAAEDVGASQGNWSRTGHHVFQSHVRRYLKRHSEEALRTITLISADQYTAEVRFQGFDLFGNPAPLHGCATELGTRFK